MSPTTPAERGWTFENGELRIRFLTTDSAEHVLRLLGARADYSSIYLPEVWLIFQLFCTIPAQDTDAAASFQVRCLSERDAAVEVILLRGFPKDRIAVGFQILLAPAPAGVSPCEHWSSDHATFRAFVAAVEETPQYRALADSPLTESIVFVDELETNGA